MPVIEFPDGKNQETKITIVWKDEEKATNIVCTAFGHADDRAGMLVFYNDNLSDLPIMLVNESMTKRIEIDPLIETSSAGEAKH